MKSYKRNLLSSLNRTIPNKVMSRSVFINCFIIIIAGCSTLYKASPMMDQLKIDDITPQELQIRVREFSNHFARAVEEASDRIMEMSIDPSIRKHALAWKIHAIPECHTAAMENDPLMAFIDTWTFTAQIADYFETGDGKNVFGKFQPIVIDTSRNLETQIMNDLKEWVILERFEKAKKFVKDWTFEHPIKTHFFSRDSTLPHLTDLFRESRKGTLATVGSLDQNTRDIANRISFLTKNLPREARWHAEYLLETTVSRQNIDKILESMTTLVVAIERMTNIVEQGPKLIDREHIAIFTEIQKERDAVLESINKQRIETISVLKDELVGIIKAFQKERLSTVKDLQNERIETLKEILNITSSTVKDASERMEGLMDSMFWRFCWLLACLVGAGLVFGTIILWVMAKRGQSHPPKT